MVFPTATPPQPNDAFYSSDSYSSDPSAPLLDDITRGYQGDRLERVHRPRFQSRKTWKEMFPMFRLAMLFAVFLCIILACIRMPWKYMVSPISTSFPQTSSSCPFYICISGNR